MLDYLTVLKTAVDSLFDEICYGAQFDILWQFLGEDQANAIGKLFKKFHLQPRIEVFCTIRQEERRPTVFSVQNEASWADRGRLKIWAFLEEVVLALQGFSIVAAQEC